MSTKIWTMSVEKDKSNIDIIAGLAMKALIMSSGVAFTEEEIARRAYLYADALIDEKHRREKCE